MSEYYTATWIPTGEKVKINETSLHNAWNRAIECFKDEIISELKPTSFINPDTRETTPTFKMLLITGYIKVEKEKTFQVTLYQNLKEPETSIYVPSVVQERGFVDLNLPTGVEQWIYDWLMSGKMSKFTCFFVDVVGEETTIDIVYK